MPMNTSEIEKPCHVAITYCASRGWTARCYRRGVLVTSGSGRSETNALQAMLRSERQRMNVERYHSELAAANADLDSLGLQQLRFTSLA